MLLVGNPQKKQLKKNPVLFDSGIGAVITIQLHLSTFWGSFCEIGATFMKKSAWNYFRK